MAFNDELDRISLLENLGYSEDLIESINEAIETDDKSIFGTYSNASEAMSAIKGAINGEE